MLGSTVAMTRRAREGGFAVPAVNVVDDLSLRAVLRAAVDTSSPLIIQASVKTVRSVGTSLLTEMVRNATRDCPVPVALHLDHCPDAAVIADVVSAGWSSVLFDASDRPLPQAASDTKAIVELAHRADVDVESEIENIIGVEDGVGSDVAVHAYSVEQIVEVARETGADLLAPQLGTAHGEYRTRPQLRPDRARRLADLTDLPIVLHGGTGLSESEFTAFIAAGVSKINISTAVKLAYMRSADAHLQRARSTDRWDPPSMFADIHDVVRQEIIDHIEIFGAAGRARTVGTD